MLELEELKKGSAISSKYFDFTVLTPLFMHGWQVQVGVNKQGNPTNKPINAELRGSSFRGILRYWWRSLQADGHSKDSLLENEQTFFGGSLGE